MRALAAVVAVLAGLGCQTASADSGLARPASNVASAPQAASARFRVEGMACDRCSARLRDGLRKLDGVVGVEADHQKKEVVVRYDAARVTLERIKQEIQRFGFEVS